MQACAGCAQPECPHQLPIAGEACDVCGPTHCAYDVCGDGAGLLASCSPDGGGGSTWSLDDSSCQPPPPCGPDATSPACALGELCVTAVFTTGPTSTVEYACEPNPCMPYETSCDCASALCTQLNAPLCISATSQELHCDNGAQ